MLDESSNDHEPPERKSNEIDCLVGEEFSSNKFDDYSREYHDRYWLEIFRRALKENDQCAQKRVQQKFRAILLDWIHDHPNGDLACLLHTDEYYLIETFKCFWQTSHNKQKFDLASMTAVLSHLHISMNGIILDTLRNYSWPQEALLTSTSMAGEVRSNQAENSREIWRLIEGKLSNAREQRLAYLLFQCALKPRCIVESFPEEFSDVSEISRVRRNIMQLLNHRNHPTLAL